jgi:hypothetical protein
VPRSTLQVSFTQSSDKIHKLTALQTLFTVAVQAIVSYIPSEQVAHCRQSVQHSQSSTFGGIHVYNFVAWTQSEWMVLILSKSAAPHNPQS